ncbi:MAG: RHS repeat-associated core domain-containing protein [Deltaproteobacteria bacterium]|nr:RHS repeat-associated core domain-containing protein [Deltaproteobacteria bacterium]
MADRSVTQTTFNEANEVVLAEDASGLGAAIAYDALGRVSLIDVQGDSDDVHFDYDENAFGIGHLSRMTDGSGSTELEYNARGSIVRQRQIVDATTRVVSYEYDALGLVTAMVYPSSLRIALERDASGRVSSVSAQPAGGAEARVLFDDMTYLPGVGIAGYRLATDSSMTRRLAKAYDGGVLVGLTTDGLIDVAFEYDGDGLLTKVNDRLTPSQTETYAYDAERRLIQATGPYGMLSYAYDALGNRLEMEADANIDTYEYEAGTNRLVRVIESAGHVTHFGYDAAGRATMVGDVEFSIGPMGRPVEARRGAQSISYRYNGWGHRVAEESQVFTYNNRGELLSDGNFEYIYLGGRPVAMVQGQNIYYVHTDAIGAAIRVTNTDGETQWSATRTPFGIYEVDPASTMDVRLRLPGQREDPLTGLHYNLHRDYSPQIGRFVSVDPLGLAGGLNPFSYALNNPISARDPLGLQYDPGLAPFALDSIPDVASNPVIDGLAEAVGQALAEMVAAAGLAALFPEAAPVIADAASARALARWKQILEALDLARTALENQAKEWKQIDQGSHCTAFRQCDANGNPSGSFRKQYDAPWLKKCLGEDGIPDLVDALEEAYRRVRQDPRTRDHVPEIRRVSPDTIEQDFVSGEAPSELTPSMLEFLDAVSEIVADMPVGPGRLYEDGGYDNFRVHPDGTWTNFDCVAFFPK